MSCEKTSFLEEDEKEDKDADENEKKQEEERGERDWASMARIR